MITNIEDENWADFIAKYPKSGLNKSQQLKEFIREYPHPSIPMRNEFFTVCSTSASQWNRMRKVVAEEIRIEEERLAKERKKNPNKNPQLPPIDPKTTFPDFCRLHSYPTYRSLYDWQVEWHKEIWRHKISLTKCPRDHGKSVSLGNISEWAMGLKDYDVLYLGWTDRRKEVAQNIFNYFYIRGEILQDKASSNYHFKTVLGTRFDTYSVMSKDILGKHEVGKTDREITKDNDYLADYVKSASHRLLMIIDDPIDDSFREEQHKEDKLERRYASTITNINPDKMLIVGTHKFEGDFLHYIQKTERQCYIFKRATHLMPRSYIPKSDPAYNKNKRKNPNNILYFGDVRYNLDLVNNPTNLLCPERWIEPGCTNYDVYDLYHEFEPNELEEKEIFKGLPPAQERYWRKLFGKKDLKRKREIVGEYWWHAEYEQNPHTIKGSVFKDFIWVNSLQAWGGYRAFDAVSINVDRATTTNETSDETGITIEAKHAKTQKRLVLEDLTAKYELDEAIDVVEARYLHYKELFLKAKFCIPIEKQGGGDDFISLAKAMGKAFANDMEPIHSSRNKINRISDYLKGPINNGILCFLITLKQAPCVIQLGGYPYGVLVDSMDCLAFGDFHLRTVRNTSYDPKKVEGRLLQMKHAISQNQGYKHPWEQAQQVYRG